MGCGSSWFSWVPAPVYKPLHKVSNVARSAGREARRAPVVAQVSPAVQKARDKAARIAKEEAKKMERRVRHEAGRFESSMRHEAKRIESDLRHFTKGLLGMDGQKQAPIGDVSGIDSRSTVTAVGAKKKVVGGNAEQAMIAAAKDKSKTTRKTLKANPSGLGFNKKRKTSSGMGM